MRATIATLALLCACGNAPASPMVFTPLAGPQGGYVTLGTACVPAQESDPSFGGFDRNELGVESSPGQQSDAPVCLVNHFQGRVTCPYGQAAPGDAGPVSCQTTKGQPVLVAVPPQCLSRRAADTVTWSCQCGGDPASGEAFCSCPPGLSCTSLGPGAAYCVPSSASEDPSCPAECDPAAHPCD